MHAEGEGNNIYDDLSDDQRDEIRRAAEDGFPAGYEDLLAEYYQRLAAAEALDAVNDEASDDE